MTETQTAPAQDLVLESLSKSYPGVHALTDVTMTVEGGSIHALLGENGAGKSTLIRLLAGVEEPDSGTMRFGSQTYRPTSPVVALRSRVSTIYQEQNLFLDRSVAHNILAGDEPARFGVLHLVAMRSSAEHQLSRLGSAHIPTTATVGALTVADRQMVSIAKALHRRCRLLIMDEPTAALTSREVDALFQVVKGLPALGTSVVFVSHRMEEIYRLSDAVTVLRDGRVALTAATAQTTAPDLIRAMIGRDPDTAYPPRRRPGVRRPVLDAVAISGKAFDKVSFTVHAGEVLALAGVTSSGKEEVAMTLLGASPLSGGRVLVDGVPRRLTPRRAAALGIVGVPADRKQDGVVGALSVQRNLSLPALRAVSHWGVMRRDRERAVARHQVTSLGIKTASLSTPVEQLSGGNQQKVSLGKWLHETPHVLVLVEPTQGIDVGVKFDFYRLVQRFAAAGAGVLLVSSDVPEVLGMADEIVVLRGGRTVGTLGGTTATSEALLRLSLGTETAAS